MNRAELESQGFAGFVPLRSLPKGCPEVSASPGIYVVLCDRSPRPSFLRHSVGGTFKQRDPAVAVSKLDQKWVEGAETIYIGKARSLRRRIDQFARFGRGEPIGHWGGRYIWQLAEHDSLLVAWFLDQEPELREATLIDQFVSENGSLPFANLNRPSASVPS